MEKKHLFILGAVTCLIIFATSMVYADTIPILTLPGIAGLAGLIYCTMKASNS
ncbi:hypothetical protein PRVXH_001832 [Proteinivorax hydrogeniformans]|uniref:Uncharacterized protein n=1 Tax=Proteinivorax hydrogeniformans TaxID=1826727 RepID=A0AAU8HRZ7_9FIRM